MNRHNLWLVPAAFLAAGLLGCPDDTGPDPEPDAPIDPAFFCPGSDGCAGGSGALQAGAAAVAFTPVGFEVANPLYLKHDRPDSCEPGLPSPDFTTCGELKLDIILDDCGKDASCLFHDDYVGPDADGSENDGDRTDYFLDCGRDRLCPGDDGYTAPDADGSEGDGVFQALWIAGYGNNRPAMGVKDDLWARAVVFRVGDVTVAQVTIDAVGHFYDETLRVRDRVEQARPGEVDYLMMQSTHTHEAPDTLGQWGLENPFSGLQIGHGRDDDHMERLRQAATDAVVQALDGLTPATVRAGTINTRVDGFLHDGRDPMIFNDLLTAVHVQDEGGGTIATLVNWGNHPEILDSRNNYISSDFPHMLRVALEEGLPATDTHPARPGLGGVAIYQQGTVGGLMGPNGFPFTGRDGTMYENRYKTWARCDAYGALLADQAFAALDDAVDVDVSSLSVSAQPYEAPVRNVIFQVGFNNGWFDRELLRFDPTLAINEDNLPFLRTEVSLTRLGPISWLSAPGEMFPESFVGFSADWMNGDPIDPDNENPPDLDAAPDAPPLMDRLLEAEAQYPILLGLGNDETGYLVLPYDFKLNEDSAYLEEAPGDHYEETNSIGPDAVPMYLQNAELLLEHDARSRAAP